MVSSWSEGRFLIFPALVLLVVIRGIVLAFPLAILKFRGDGS